MAGASAIRVYARASLVFAAALFLALTAGACRKRANNSNANSNLPSGAGNLEEARRNAQALVDQAKELYKNDEDDRAAQGLEQAVKLDPNNAEAHLRLGMAYAALERKPEAEDEYKKAIDLFKKKIQTDPKNGRSFFSLGKEDKFHNVTANTTRANRT